MFTKMKFDSNKSVNFTNNISIIKNSQEKEFQNLPHYALFKKNWEINCFPP